MVAAVLLSSERMDWQTPELVLELVRKVGHISLDPCTTRENPVDAAFWLHPGVTSGLDHDWDPYCEDPGFVVYVNPPYGRELPRWVDKWRKHSRAGGHLILLVPARPDTAWWFRALASADALCFWRGRLTFKGAPAPAPFPSALFYAGPRPHRFADVFQDHGAVTVRRHP